MQLTIHVYSDLVCRRIFDSVPKMVHLFLIDEICNGFVPSMLDKIDSITLRRWLAEDAESRRRREDVESKLFQFEEAAAILKSADGTLK